MFQFVPSFFLGVVLGLLTLRTGSIVPAMLLHLLHHGAMIGGMHAYSIWRDSIPDYVAYLWLPFNVACLVAAAILLWRLYRAPYKT